MAHEIPRVRMLHGDEADLFRTHEVALRAAVRYAVRAPEAVIEDACSFAWLQLLRRQPNRDTIFGWLRTVAIREAWRLAERESREANTDRIAHDYQPGQQSVTTSAEAHDALAALAALPPRQRRYLTLLISGHSYTEIARHHGVTYTNVNRHLTRARRHLRIVRDDT